MVQKFDIPGNPERAKKDVPTDEYLVDLDGFGFNHSK